MTLITEDQLKRLAADSRGYKSAAAVLKEEMAAASDNTSFDIFLSHSFKDADVVLGVKKLFERKGIKVYVDWIEDSQLDRTKVTFATAATMRTRMKQSKSLVYLHSNNSPQSKWMPWELGFFDGFRSAVAILPVAKSKEEAFNGQEFLGLYPYIDGDPTSLLWVNRGNAPRSSLGSVDVGASFKKAELWFREIAGVRF